MKKSDESNNRLQEDSSVTVHGLRRFNKRQGTVGSNSSIIRNCQGIETLNRSGKVLDSWHSAEKDEEATYFWNSDDMGRTKNNNSFLRSIISNNYTSVAQGNCMNSSEAKHSCTTGPISQRMQKIIPCGYAPNRFPVTVTTVPRECWPKTCCANPFYAFSGTNTLPSARISSSSPSAIQPLPSTSSFNPLSASEQTVYLTSDDGCKSQTLPVGLLRRFENDASVRGVLGMEREKFSKFHLGSEIFHRKLSFSKRNGGRECTSGNGRQLHEGALDKKKEAVEDVKKKRGAFLIWSSGDKGIKNVRNKSSKGASSHEKPRMPKFLQSFCCCIRPEATIKAKRRTLHPAPSTSTPQSLITQVTKNPQNGTNLNGTSVSVNDSYSANDYDGTGEYVPIQPSDKLLLPPVRPCDGGKKCLIIDLDETLVHSSFKPVKNPDFIIPVEIDNVIHQVYVLKRPYVDEFLERIGDKFECVLFTASLAKYADPVADFLDKRGVFRARLFRESCVFHKGNYVKDLTRLGRDLKKVIIVDNSPASYAFHPDNAIPVQTWFDDANDVELLDIIPVLEQLAEVDSIYTVLRNSNDDMRRNILSEQNETSRSS